jgi:type I restriction enzyme S subunit
MVLRGVTDEISPGFLHYLLRSSSYIGEYRRLAYGVRPSQWRLMQEEFRLVPILVPPHNEQKKIAERIENAETSNKEAEQKISTQIDRLHEYRQALITAAVTGQLAIEEAA